MLSYMQDVRFDGNDTKEERSLILRDRSDRARSGDPIA